MSDLLFLIPLFPLVAFAINLLLGRTVIRERAHWVAIPAVALSWVGSLLVLIDIARNDESLRQELFQWIPAGDFDVRVSLYADQLTAVMLMVVTTVGLLVHIYSVGYMHGDGGYYRFFAYLPLFIFSMLMLVLADNYLVLFVFWEAVGLCSFLLIGYYFRRRSAGNAARKAFIVNRIGDLGFGLGIMMIFWTFGTVNFYGETGVFALAPGESEDTLTVIALLLFLGACGKSAQFPLHVWLPDAMEGPTPVSALIHAATMVTAGVYMVARSQNIFLGSETAMTVVTLIGAITAIMAASIALAQNDIKRVIAYSTVSQLGYMTMALGMGAWMAAIFHLLTHAFFKGLLFLGAGSVIHGMDEEQNIQKMGNLRKYMPTTYWTFLVAALANAGVIPFAGFWSKDEIIVGGWVSDHQPIGQIAMVVGLVAAFLTALYMFRLVFLVFHTTERFDQREVHPHESPSAMTWPLILLAIPAALIGFVGVPPEDGIYHRFIEPVFYDEAPEGTEEHAGTAMYTVAEMPTTGAVVSAQDAVEPASQQASAHVADGLYLPHEVSTETSVLFGVISTVVALSGIGVAYLAYIRGAINPVSVAARFQPVYQFLLNRWYIDELYNMIFVQPLRSFANFLWNVVDEGIIDAFVNGVGTGIAGLSQRLRHVQTGLVANYALAIALGMVLLVGIYLTGFSNLFR